MNEKSASKKNKDVKNNSKLDDFFKNIPKKRERDENIEMPVREKKPKIGILNLNLDEKVLKSPAKSKQNKSKKKEKSEAIEVKPNTNRDINNNRNSCSICRDGGDLLLCDGCPKSFHLSCLKLKENDIGDENWYCAKCVPKIERKKKRESEIEERSKVRNEKRKLYRKKKKEEMKNKLLGIGQNNIININVIMNNQNDQQQNIVDVTLQNGKHNSTNLPNILKTGIENILTNINSNDTPPKEEVTKRGKQTIKYPIPDEELYANPKLHKLGPIYFAKPEGIKSEIPNKYFTKILKIWDFVHTFKEHLNISSFTPNQLLNSLASDQLDSNLLNEVHVSLLYIFLEEIDSSYELNNLSDENELLLLKIAVIKNEDKRLMLYKCWPEILRILINSNLYDLMLTDEIRDISMKLVDFDINSYNKNLLLDQKIVVLEYLIDTAVSTDFIKDIIKDDLEKRNNINKEKNQLIIELKAFEARKRELDRAEKFAEPQARVETLNKKLSTLVEDNQQLTRQALTKLRKGIEQEREEVLSIIKEAEQIEVNIEKMNTRIEKLQFELSSILSTNRKKLGVDAFGTEYYYFHDINDRLYLKKNKGTEWRELSSSEEFDTLIERLSEKGIDEKNLIHKLKKIIKKIKFDKMQIDEEWTNKVIKVPKKVSDPFDDLSDNFEELEKRITEYLYQDNKEWESFENRQTWKAYIRFKKDINEYASSLILFNEKFKNPYLVNEYKSKIIDDSDVYSLNIYNNSGVIDPYRVDPARILASKARLWSRDFEALDAEIYMKEYILETKSISQIFFAYFIFSGVVNDLIARREVYKIYKKKDDLGNIIQQDEPQSPQKKIKETVNFDLDEYLYDSDNKPEIISTRSRRLVNRKENTVKTEEWNDTCYICERHGNLICCDSCKNVAHLTCLGLKKNPESFTCEDCNYNLVYKRQTRSSKINK